jgi:2Fe-2S ferredoxin
MPEIVVLPHPELCPDGKTFEGTKDLSLLDNLLDQGIAVEHACKSCACTTCHVIVREVRLARAVDRGRRRSCWIGLGPDAGVAVVVPGEAGDAKLVVEIPKYTINYAKENK